MRIICPACGAMASLEALLTDGDARAFMEAFYQLSATVQPYAFRYLALFRPTGRVLQWRKATRLLAELTADIRACHIQVKGSVARPASPETWAAAMARLIETPPQGLPLSNHNYLRKIVYDLADAADRKRETERNRMERSGIREHRVSEGFGKMDPETMKQIRKQHYPKKGRP